MQRMIGSVVILAVLLAGCSTDQAPSTPKGPDQTVVENGTTYAEKVETAPVDQGRAAGSQSTSLDPITRSFEIEGHPIEWTIYPKFRLSGGAGLIEVDLNALIDASDLQNQFPTMMNRSWDYDECGVRTSTRSATIRPAANGQLFVGITGRGEIWECVKTKIPETYRKVRDLGLLGKHKLPAIRWKMKTAKTRVVSQSISIEALAHLVFRHNTVTAVIEVTSARPSGLLGMAVALLDPLLDLRDKVTDLAQEKIEEKLLDKRFRLPEEFRDFNVTINSSKFIGMDGGLGVEVSASGSITQDQLATLINESVD